jgi:hypothetical protein
MRQSAATAGKGLCSVLPFWMLVLQIGDVGLMPWLIEGILMADLEEHQIF